MPEATEKTDNKNKTAPAKPADANQNPRPELTQNSYNTRFLAPPFEEIQAAAYLLRKMYPELPEELLNECLTEKLNLEGVNRGTEVWVMVRKKFGRQRFTDAQGFERGEDGARNTVHAGDEIIANEIKILGPVCAKDHWVAGSHEWNAELDRNSFISAIAKLATPWACQFPDAASKRAGEQPKLLALSLC